MANITGMDSGLVVESVESVKVPKKKKRPSPTAVTCWCCGYSFEGSYAQVKKHFKTETDDDGKKERTCIACNSFFGLSGVVYGGVHAGYTNVSPEETKKLLKRAKEDKYIILLKTMNFGSEKSGITFTVDFGDIFKVKRVGTSGEAGGTRDDVFKRFTIDIDVGVDVLTLYPHEFGVMTWIEIMQLRQEKMYEEAYLCQEDKEGYFKPTDEGRELITNMFGER